MIPPNFARRLPWICFVVALLELTAWPAMGQAPAEANPRGGRRPRPQQEHDVVLLKDGTVLHGDVVELGNNRIAVEQVSGSRQVYKRDIERVEFYRERQGARRLDTDLIILKNGHRLAGEVKLLKGDQEVRITLQSGATVTYARRDVVRILRRNELFTSTSTHYTRELEENVASALAELRSAEPDVAARAENYLIECGIFAVERARRELTEIGSGPASAAALERILRAYEIKEVVSTAMEEEHPHIYRVLTSGTPQERLSFLEVLLPAHIEDAVDLALLLIRDSREHEQIRALAVEVLKRLQQNRALVKLYNETTGEAAGSLRLVAALALAENGILLGVPTLIEALALESQELRRLASETLRTATGQDFQYRSDGAPAARQAAIARWQAWWDANEEQLTAASKAILASGGRETEERRLSRELWKQAHEAWAEDDLANTERLLRNALRLDPTFEKASISLAVLLATAEQNPESVKLASAEKLLEDLAGRLRPDAPASDRYWVHLELANIYRLKGKAMEALRSYEESHNQMPNSVPALLGMADSRWTLATGAGEESREERRGEIREALQGYETARKQILENLRGLRSMRAEELIPGHQLPFERREYNRTVIEVRKAYEAQLARLALKIAKAEALLGDRKKAALTLRAGLQDLGLAIELPGAKVLEAELRRYLGLIYETLGQDILALEEYRKVLGELDPEDENCRKAVERLRRKAGAANQPAPSREARPRSRG
jgi:tetratricopeptide (TPR) repeat protein